MDSSGYPPPPPPPTPSAPPHSPPHPSQHESETEQTYLQALNQDDSSRGEIVSSQRPRRPNLSSLEIPGRSLENSTLHSTRTNIPPSATPTSTRAGLPPRPPSVRAKSSISNLPPQWSRINNSTTNGDRTTLLMPVTSPQETNKPSILRTFSRQLFLSPKMAHSLPVTPFGNSCAQSAGDRHVIDIPTLDKPKGQKQFVRSLSTPRNAKGRSLRIVDSPCLIRVVPVTPCPVHAGNAKEIETAEETNDEDGGEDILEEEAICRICFVELGEGGETLKMACSCKGELALAHEECAIKWFSLKGNKICEVCKSDVQNLPVTLLRLPSARYTDTNTIPEREDPRHRMWQDIPLLSMVSMLAYFCFIEQLLVDEMGSQALALSVPFSCVLGVLSSFISCTMVNQIFIWAYASVQFAIVVFFAHIFYTLLRIVAIFSILLSSFTGFGVVIGVNILAVEYMRWRTRRNQLIVSNGSLQQPSANNGDAEHGDDALRQEAAS
ncbi:hypothetical protein KSP39_PZI003230 [Platanthera zijinensis]|uniref:RING-CH-type domain-containing protein n=1 Tax=Platanthera zijinensis TaxID=2320716 RepID=A0AAP0BXR6_9ASPA